MLGVARYFPNPDGESCEFAVTVADAWHGRGVGTVLMSRLIGAARAAGYREISGSILRANEAMLRLADELKFERRKSGGDPGVVEVVRMLV
jgi:acetyltransferase